MGKFVSKTNLSYVWSKIKSLLGNKQDKITSSNKLSKDLVSGLGTASTVNTGTSNGNVPVIGTNGKLPSSVIPASAITDTFVANSQSAMLGLSSAEVGDVCVRTDLNKSFILKATPYSTLANWQELLTPTDAVTSVNGQTGAVNLTIPTNNNQLTNGAGYVTSSGSVASATNSTKLNNQDASYYLNYNNLSNKPTIPTTYIKSASQSTTSASQFIDINGDRTTTTLTDASGGTKSITSWVYQNAVGDPTNATTGGKAGLMSAADKNKLDSIDTSNLATKNDLPTNPLTLSTQSSYNCNVLYDGKVWLIANGSNCPSGSPYGALFTMPYRKASGNASPDFGAQIFIPNGDDATKPNSMFFRTSLSSSWNSWQEVAVKNDLGTQATFSLSGTTLTITPK